VLRRLRHTRPLAMEEREAHDFLGNAHDLLEPGHARLLEAGVPRAGGETSCEACGHAYLDHPSVVGALWATEICGGRLVKL